MQMIELQLWHLISLLLSFMGCVAGFWKFTESRREKAEDIRWQDFHRHLDNRFQDITSRFKDIVDQRASDMKKLADLERDFIRFQTQIAADYVRREDYVQWQSSMQTKVDAFVLRIDNAQLRMGIKND